MLGENTLFLTRKGFKTLKNLNKYDEVMTGYGDFAHIVELGPWIPMTKCAILSTGERIYCTDDTLWNVSAHRTFKFTDELDLEDDAESCTPIFELPGVKGRYKSGSYKKSVTVPKLVPDECLLCDVKTRLEFLAGLIDSPICEIGSGEGIYVFYTQSDELYHGIIALVRSLGFGVSYRRSGLVHIIRVYINKYIDALPVRDEYKESWDYASIIPPVKVIKII